MSAVAAPRRAPRSAVILMAGAALAMMGGALAAQESLLPPGFDDRPAPSPSRSPRPAATRAAAPPPRAAATPRTAAAPRPVASASPVARPAPAAAPLPATVPEDTAVTAAPGAPLAVRPAGGAGRTGGEDIDPALIDELVRKYTPKFDIPPDRQRSLAEVGFLAEADGGFPAVSSHYLNGPFVEGLIAKTRGPLVSRWGHILLRRALASRLDTPVGMNGADWAAVRAQLLLRMGEADAARELVQAVDSGFYSAALEDAAMASYLATADPVGLCPVTALTAAGRAGWDWAAAKAICLAFSGGEGGAPLAELDRALRRGQGQKIDLLLAQKFAGAAIRSRRAVTIEWQDVDSLSPWRTGLAFATGIEPPERLRAAGGAAYALLATRAPMLSLPARAQAADVAAAQGVLSAAAMVDLYAQLAALDQPDARWSPLAGRLRTAYVAPSAADRLAAIKGLWGDGSDPVRAYSRLVLTAYAAARMAPDPALADDAAGLIASMLTAGLDQNAMRWAAVVPAGSESWGLLALAAPAKLAPVSGDNLQAFRSNDTSAQALRSRFLLAGLVGLGRVDDATARDFAKRIGVDLARETRWTQAIDAAAQSDNPTLVALLAGFGMQGESWARMTPLHLAHIVGALRRVGLEGEARMIAAEAVARV